MVAVVEVAEMEEVEVEAAVAKVVSSLVLVCVKPLQSIQSPVTSQTSFV